MGIHVGKKNDMREIPNKVWEYFGKNVLYIALI
jgi:hypothetical protein